MSENTCKMDKRVLYGVFSLCVIAFVSMSFADGNNWSKVKDKKGIQVFSRLVSGKKFKEARAEMIVNKPADQVFKVISNFNNYDKWMPSCSVSKVLKSGENELVYYQVFKAPLVSNRDLVAKATFTNLGAKGYEITIKGMPNYLTKQGDNVRILDTNGKWEIKPQKDGTTFVSNTYYSDPGGGLPTWLVNSASDDVPFDMFESLRTYLNN